MNPTAQSEGQSRSKLGSLTWLPILLLLAAIIVARVAGLRETYESHMLLLLLSFTFYTLVSLGTLYLIGRSFLASGSPGLLLLECGVVLWSLAGTVGDLVSHGDANINVTIFNIGILLAGLCHLAGAILALNPQRVFRRKALWLGAGCVFTLGALWLISQAALSGWLPVFFIPGRGGTLVRHAVLISAIAMFVLSAGVLHAYERAPRLPFTSWYELALLTLAVGLFGIMIQLSLGSVVNWLSRTAQWLGGLYLLFAALASLRESHLPLFPLEKKSHPAYYRDAVAVAVVLTAAAIRLAFLSAMGTRSPYVVFFPAVMFAAIYGGLRPGLLATAISAILTDYFWIEPVNQLKIGQLSDQLSIVIFLLSGGMISWVTDSMQRARTRASAAEAQALLAAEREKTAEALRESEARRKVTEAVEAERHRLYNVLETVPAMVCLLTTDYHVVFANRSFREKFGESAGRHCYEYCFGLTAPCDFCETYNVLKTGKPHHWECTTPDGNTIIDAHDFPFTDADGSSLILEMGIDITAWRQAEEALRMARDQVQFFASQCLTAQEVERRRVAGELHDSVAASLGAMRFRIDKIADEMKQGHVASESLQDLGSKVVEINTEVRRIMADLRPSILDDLGIIAAMNWFCREYEKTYSHISVQNQIGVSDPEVPDSLKTPIFRICQEAMNNTAKYSKATLVSLRLQKASSAIELTIQDNGQGFDLDAVKKGMGLSTMRERAELSGGSFDIESAMGKGTLIRASWTL